MNGLAAADGVSPEEYRQRLAGMAEVMLGRDGVGLGDGTAAAVAQMINEPRGTFRITVAPETPVSLGALKKARDPVRQIGMLNLKVGSEGLE